MNGDDYTRRLMGRLPAILQGGENLGRLLAPLGEELARMEKASARVYRSRWVHFAESWAPGAGSDVKQASELARIGALYGLDPHPDLNETPETFKARLFEWISIYRGGLGTVSAILRLVALVYRAEAPPKIVQQGRVTKGIFYARDHLERRQRVEVEIEDNPLIVAEKKVTLTAGQETAVVNAGLDEAVPEIAVTAVNADLRYPILTQVNDGTGILFLGTIPKGSTLKLRRDLPPLLGDRITQVPILMSYALAFDDPDARFSTPEAPRRFATLRRSSDSSCFAPDQPPDEERPNPANAAHFSTPEAPYRFATFGQGLELLPLALGENRYRFGIMSEQEVAKYTASEIDRMPRADRDTHERRWGKLMLEDLQGSAMIVFRWIEATPATFALRIPASFLPFHLPDFTQLAKALQRALDAGRAAGIRALIEVVLSPFPEDAAAVEGLKIRSQALFRETHEATEDVLQRRASLSLSEKVSSADRFRTAGIFDNAHFDSAMFG